MERKSTARRTSFFRVLTEEDYTTSLRLPDDFANKYGEFLVKNAKLRNSGRIWNVKIVQESEDDSDEKHYLFKEGWNEFAKCFDIKRFDLLVLWFNINESVFDVFVYDPKSYSEREISAPMNVINNKCHVISGKCGGKKGNKSFEAVIKYYNKNLLDIPKAFALETGIAWKREIKLENEEGKEWTVHLPIMKGGRIRMVKGWNDFLIQNKMVFGNTYLFEFNATSGNLIMKKKCTGPSKKGKKYRLKIQLCRRKGQEGDRVGSS